MTEFALGFLIGFLIILEIRQMATLDDTLAAVTAASTKTDSLIALTAGLKKQLDDVLAGVTLPAGVQAKIDQIFALETDDAAKIDAAITANTPPGP